MNDADDYDLWKMWWLAVVYGASATKRMEMMDKLRYATRRG